MRRRLLCSLVMLAACNGTPSSGSHPTTSGRDTGATGRSHDAAAPTRPIDGGTMPDVFTASSADDLDVPLAMALAAAEQAGATTFTVRIVPGRYRGDLIIEPTVTPPTLAVTVEPDGDGVVVFDGGKLQVQARDVTVRGVLLDGTRGSMPALSLRATGTLLVERVAVVGAQVGARDLRAPVIELIAPSGTGTATLRDLWIVGCTTQSAPVIAVPVNGRSRFEAVTLENVVLAGNTASTGIDPFMARRLEVRGALVDEPFLAGAWLTLRTPQTAVRVEDALVAVRKGLVAYVAGEDVKAADFPKVAIAHAELRGPSKQERLEASDVTWGEPPAAVADLAWATTAARQGAAPDRATLRAHLD